MLTRLEQGIRHRSSHESLNPRGLILKTLVVATLSVSIPSSGQTFPDWTPSAANPIFATVPNVFVAPSVIKESGIYTVWGGGGQLFIATSPDGIQWSTGEALPGMEAGPAGSFNQSSLFGAWVLFNPDKALYEMWYTGQMASGFSDFRIGYASSPDGLNWTKAAGTGTGGSVIDKGGPGSGEEGAVQQPVVLLEEVYKMWYSGRSQATGNSGFGENGVFYAESPDGVHWTKFGQVISGGPSGSDTFGGHSPQAVVRSNGQYHLWYEIDNDQSTISGTCYSTSFDGLNWTPCVDASTDFVAVPNEPWCTAGPCHPKPKAVIRDGPAWEMWYQRQAVFALGYAVATDEAPEVVIDIKPGSFPNSIHLKSKGVIPVAVLTTDTAGGDDLDFDAAEIDSKSVAFGPAAAPIAHSQGHLEDVDEDGDLDLVLHFRTNETGIVCGDTSASLTASTFEGNAISGSDSIRTVGCH